MIRPQLFVFVDSQGKLQWLHQKVVDVMNNLTTYSKPFRLQVTIARQLQLVLIFVYHFVKEGKQQLTMTQKKGAQLSQSSKPVRIESQKWLTKHLLGILRKRMFVI